MEKEVTQMLSAWRGGDAAARDQLIATIYPELRRLADQLFRRERGNHTLQPTALVSEAWLKLAGLSNLAIDDRRHLFALTARLMREILIDHARQRNAAKRDGGERVTLTGVDLAANGNDVDLIDLDVALEQLETIDATKARIVELRYFGGLNIEETGDALSMSPATVKRHWQAARVWLFNAIANA